MINHALQLASFSYVEKNKVGCVITYKKGKILSIGVNSDTKTHPIQKKFAVKSGQAFREFLHAEIQALVRIIGTDQAPHTLYVARITQAGKTGMSKPCPVCEMAIREAGVVKVIYTISDGSSKEYYV